MNILGSFHSLFKKTTASTGSINALFQYNLTSSTVPNNANTGQALTYINKAAFTSSLVTGRNFCLVNAATANNYFYCSLSLTSINAWTMCCWIQSNAINYGYAMTLYNGSNAETRCAAIFIHKSGSMFMQPLYWNGATQNNGTTMSYTANTWYHVGLTSDGTTLRFYVNGSQQSTINITGKPMNTPNAFYVLGGPGFGAIQGNPLLDDVRVYDRTLTASEMSAIYTTGSP